MVCGLQQINLHSMNAMDWQRIPFLKIIDRSSTLNLGHFNKPHLTVSLNFVVKFMTQSKL
jgi:hypothetical protein